MTGTASGKASTDSKGSRNNNLAFWRERRAGRCKAPRRRRCRCASSRSGNAADARPPPRPEWLRPRKEPHFDTVLDFDEVQSVKIHNVTVARGAATKCQVIIARALRSARSSPQRCAEAEILKRKTTNTNFTNSTNSAVTSAGTDFVQFVKFVVCSSLYSL